jgi:dynein heavy chain
LTVNASRWPLCIDPQLQALNWIKKKVEKDLKVLNINEGAGVFLKPLENAIKYGKPVLFESVYEELDPTLDPILEKNFITRAGVKFLKLGENEIEFNNDF